MKLYLVENIYKDKVVGFSTSKEIAEQKRVEYEKKYGGRYWVEEYPLEKDSWYEF